MIDFRKRKKSRAKEIAIGAGILITGLAATGYGDTTRTDQAIVQAGTTSTSASIQATPTLSPEMAEITRLRREIEELKASRGGTSREEFRPEKVMQAITNNLQGVFLFKSQFIYDTSRKNNVNPMLIAAIIRHETANGTSKAVKELNNPGGLMGSNGLMKFSTLEAGIEKMCRVIKEEYIDKGYTSIEQIQKKYCPVGAENDPTNLNVHWLPAVTSNYLKILNEAK